ncbi:hypothetical protein [Rhizobium leguminosarum]|uniref:hypothetical protein n=1 Tax=Rhizobium leguminosarum TaxID=384 RepID=UPI00142D22E4|nr:hypothetical protein [Rhizobium leguminosarum]
MNTAQSKTGRPATTIESLRRQNTADKNQEMHKVKTYREYFPGSANGPKIVVGCNIYSQYQKYRPDKPTETEYSGCIYIWNRRLRRMLFAQSKFHHSDSFSCFQLRHPVSARATLSDRLVMVVRVLSA